MTATLTPLQMHIPSEVLTLKLEPLKVILAKYVLREIKNY